MTLCEVCDAPLDGAGVAGATVAPARASGAVTCGRVACRLAAQSLDTRHRCGHCGRPLPLPRRGFSHCGRQGCERVRLEAHRRAEAAWRTAHRAALEEEVPQVAARRGVPLADRGRIATALVPHSNHEVRPLPARRRRAFERHLRHMLEAARAPQTPEFDTPPASDTTVHAADMPGGWRALLGAVCGACRGACCSKWGGNHAYIRADTMRAARKRLPHASDDDIVAAYLAHLPARSANPGCVYQGARGCTLPREMRGETCHRYLCDGLLELTRQFGAGRDAGVYVGHEATTLAARRTFRVLPVLPGVAHD